MTEPDESIEQIVQRLATSRSLVGWSISGSLSKVPDGDVAETFFDIDARRATIQVDPAWQERDEGSTLVEIVAHEFGHLLVDDLLEPLPLTRLTKTIRERLASRAGFLLLEIADANE